MPTELETKELILAKSRHLFKSVGIKSVSMDDLAKELGMSKKTIYLHFKDKKDLVTEVFQYDIEKDKHACTHACSATDNAIQQFINISLLVNNNLKNMNPAVLFDLKKYYPNCWKQFDAFTNDFIFNFVVNNIEAGKDQGYYRPELNSKVVAMVYIALVQSLVQSSFKSHKDIPLNVLHNHMIDYHLHGICTKQGKEYIQQHLKL